MKKVIGGLIIFCVFVILLARPAAQIVPQIIQYFNGAGTSIGPVSITGQETVNGSLFVAGLGNGFGVGSISIINTTPTISSGFGTSPSVLNSNRTFNFEINVGGGGVATTGVIGLPTATNGWHCFVQDITTPTIVNRISSSTTTTATVTAASAWGANDILSLICAAF